MKRYLLIVGLLLATITLNTHALNTTPPGMNYDAAYNLTHAQRLMRGDGLAALIFDDRPEPLYRYLLAGWFRGVGDTEFSARLFQGMVGLLAVALSFRAGSLMFGRTAGFVAAGALAASMPHFFLSRSAYRALLLTPTIAATLICLWQARRTDRWREWMAAGFFAGLAINTYFAGLVFPFLILGWIVHQLVIAPRGERIRWRSIGAMIAGFIPPMLAWAWTMVNISDFMFRFHAASNIDTPLSQRLTDGVPDAFSAYFQDAYHWMTLYIVPDSPFLNPALGLLALVGIALALWRWRYADGAILLGGIVIFALPAALSDLPTHPVRLIGASVFLALLAGWGAEWLSRRIPWPAIPTVALSVLIGASMLNTSTRYHAFFASPERYNPPDSWRNIPHNYSLPLWEAMTVLAQVDRPTYVPLSAVNDRIAAFILTGTTFPHVTTAARYGLTELPAGELFYPAYDYLFNATPPSDLLMVLLLPDEGTIVILPSAAGTLDKPSDVVMSTRWDWPIAYVGEREAMTLPAVHAREDAPILGGRLRLTNPYSVEHLQAGGAQTVIYEWEVLDTFGRDAYSFTQLLDDAQNLYATNDHYMLQYLYPAQMWEAGDIIPDVATVYLPPTLDLPAYHWTGGIWVSPPGQTRLDLVSSDGIYLDTRLYWGAGRPDAPNAELGQPENPLDAVLDDRFALEGYTATQAGETLTLTLFWRRLTEDSGDFTVFIHAMRGETMIDQADVRPSPPTNAWYAGERFALTYTLTLAEVPDALYVGMYSYPSFERLSVMQDGAIRDDGRVMIVP